MAPADEKRRSARSVSAALPDMSDFWVFGYGSLMWRPGFDYLERVPARLLGAHRALCVYSWVHRGTRQRPGLVLGLDRGGSCRGIAYKVAAENRRPVTAYLRARELVTNVYLQTLREVRLEGTEPRAERALVFMVDRTHEQYAGKLPYEVLLSIVRDGVGSSGVNTDYVVATASHIRELGFRDPVLEQLAEDLKQPA